MNARRVMSWGRYPPFPQTPHPVYWREAAGTQLRSLRAEHQTVLAFGNGRSYGDSCLAVSDHVALTRPLKRFLSTDWVQGRLTAEAGITLEEILALAIPRGWFLPVTPGTKYVTLGGAIANDVHGKNHHRRGTFGRHVQQFELIRSDRDTIVCSAQQHPELFAATIGGLGLTGIISWAELQLLPLRSSVLDVTSIRFNSLLDFFALAAEFDQTHEYTVAWIDCLAQGAACGRGIFSAANHAKSGPLEVCDRGRLGIPVMPPFSTVNSLSLRLFNNFYYDRQPPEPVRSQSGYDPFFYPLDRLLHWNRFYGPRGLQQYQCVIPQQQAEAGIRELLAQIAAAGQGSFLAVMKQCGDLASPGLLSFPLHGVSLALDFPQRDALSTHLFPRLDSIVREAQGRLYPAKDAHMTSQDFQHFYPNWPTLERLRDPAMLSRFWQRVTRQ